MAGHFPAPFHRARACRVATFERPRGALPSPLKRWQHWQSNKGAPSHTNSISLSRIPTLIAQSPSSDQSAIISRGSQLVTKKWKEGAKGISAACILRSKGSHYFIWSFKVAIRWNMQSHPWGFQDLTRWPLIMIQSSIIEEEHIRLFDWCLRLANSRRACGESESYLFHQIAQQQQQ